MFGQEITGAFEVRLPRCQCIDLTVQPFAGRSQGVGFNLSAGILPQDGVESARRLGLQVSQVVGPEPSQRPIVSQLEFVERFACIAESVKRVQRGFDDFL